MLSFYMNVVNCFFIVLTKAYKTDGQTDRNGKSFKKKRPNSVSHTQTTFVEVM